MPPRKDQTPQDRLLDLLDRHWRVVVVLTWLGLCAWLIYDRSANIRAFGLGDTDDNLRMVPVEFRVCR